MAQIALQKEQHGNMEQGKTMDKMQIGKNFFSPMPMVLVGTQISGKANFMTVGWYSRANASPSMIVCWIGNRHYTPKGIVETKTVSVNIPSSILSRRPIAVA